MNEMQEELNSKFLNKFCEFEKFIKNKFRVDKFTDDFVKNNELLKNQQEFWKHCISLRNIYSHSNGTSFADIRKDKYKRFCEEVDKLMNPRTALKLAIPFSKVYKVTPNETVSNVISTMLDKNYTCTPIVDEIGKIIGVFSANSLMMYFDKNKEEILASEPSKTKISDIMDFCKFDSDPKVLYKFVSRNADEYEVSDMFKAAYDNKDRLEMLFVTEHGGKTEALNGIITHWDLLN